MIVGKAMKNNYKIKKFTFFYLKQLLRIYYASFTKQNRFSFVILIFNILLNHAEVYMLANSYKVEAFIYVINYKQMAFILYLAVKEEDRNKGYGSYLLKWYLDKTMDTKIIYGNIDEVNEKYEDNSIRNKRLDFYLKNGFYLTNYLSCNKDDKGNIFSNTKKFDIDNYIKFDKIISKWFFTTNDTIEKIN